MLNKLVIAWDLDGTLINSNHRARMVDDKFDLDFWKENQVRDMIMKDSLLPLCELFYEYQKTGFTQICVTARKMIEADFEFLEKHNLKFEMVLHRQDSIELDAILKNKKLKEYFEEKQLIPFQAFDDKQDNLEIFDSFGFRTFHAVYMNEKLKAKKYSEFELTPGVFI